MPKAYRPRSPKYQVEHRLYVGKQASIVDRRPFTARRTAVRYASKEARRLWKFHETSQITAIRSIVTMNGVPIHQLRIDRDSAENGFKRMIMFEEPGR